MGRTLAIIAAALLLFAGAVWFSVRRPPPLLGYGGLQFTAMTEAAAARTPLLAKGAVILSVDPGSPADKAGIIAGEVVAAIDGQTITSARQASDKVRRIRAGQAMLATLYDLAKSEVTPQKVRIVFAAVPDPRQTGIYSVRPPRTLAKESFAPPAMAANAVWARRIARGATTKPLALVGLGAGQCNGLAPEQWRIAGHAADNSMFHVMAPATFQHAILLSADLNGRGARDFIRDYLSKTFGAPATLTTVGPQPFGTMLLDFGNARGGAGFVEYRVRDGHIRLWIAAVAAAEAGWALPITGAVAFSLNCGAAIAARDIRMAPTAVSARCLAGKCQDSDFAAAYMKTLRLGFVHDASGHTFLINPKRDYWSNGADGPGYYHQLGGENEKLEPGRMN